MAQQQKQVEALAGMVKEQAVQIQKVNTQLATVTPANGAVELVL